LLHNGVRLKSQRYEVILAKSRKDLKRYVKFPWRIYANQGNWIPPLIRSQISKLSPDKSPFFKQGEAESFMVVKGDEVVGTVTPWMNHRSNRYKNEKAAGFGYFELIEDYEVARLLCDKVVEWAGDRGANLIRGPLHFSPQDSPGVLVEGFDSFPPPLVTHTPPYYSVFLERYGFQKYRDAFAYRVEFSQFNNSVDHLPAKLINVARKTQEKYHINIRNLNLDKWEDELKAAMYIFNEALGYQREGVPMDEAEFMKLASELKQIIDPRYVLIAEVDKRPIGLYVAFPNYNLLFRKLNGRIFPFGWIHLMKRSKYITFISTKILGVLEDYRKRGIDALFYYKIAETLMKQGEKWIDYSLVAEENKMANRLVQRLGGTVYKICRTYKLEINQSK